jgi:hypothetical protein
MSSWTVATTPSIFTIARRGGRPTGRPFAMRPHTRARRYWAAGGVWWRLAALEKPKAKERQSAAGGDHRTKTASGPGATSVPRVRDLVGPAIGVSGRTWEPRGDETSAAAGTVRGRGGGDTGRFVTLAGHLTHRCAPAAPNTQTVTGVSRRAARGNETHPVVMQGAPVPTRGLRTHARHLRGGSRTPDSPVWLGLAATRSGVADAVLQGAPCGDRAA